MARGQRGMQEQIAAIFDKAEIEPERAAVRDGGTHGVVRAVAIREPYLARP